MSDGRQDNSESTSEGIDRELIELLNELRVALPGVQVLFAFLLAVPFSQRFATVSNFQRALFFAILMATAMSSVLLIAPSAYHRLHFTDFLYSTTATIIAGSVGGLLFGWFWAALPLVRRRQLS